MIIKVKSPELFILVFAICSLLFLACLLTSFYFGGYPPSMILGIFLHGGVDGVLRHWPVTALSAFGVCFTIIFHLLVLVNTIFARGDMWEPDMTRKIYIAYLVYLVAFALVAFLVYSMAGWAGVGYPSRQHITAVHCLIMAMFSVFICSKFIMSRNRFYSILKFEAIWLLLIVFCAVWPLAISVAWIQYVSRP